VTEPAARRQLGYRLLGPWFDYLLHLRPAEWPIVAAHMGVGLVLAVGFDGVALLAPGQTLLGFALWVVCLNGGTLAINSAFDRDTGDVAYLRDPPPPPRALFGFGGALMGFGFGASWALPPGFRWAYGACMVLSLLYSVPPFRLKAVAGLDWLINMWGFGVLTTYAGWAITGVTVHFTARLILLGFCPLFAALYPLTQLYQLEEDRARGDRTLAVALGVRSSLRVALASAMAAFAMFGAAGFSSGWSGGWPALVRWAALVVALAGWLIVLLPWLRHGRRFTPAEHQGRMYLALAAWAVTDAAILIGFGR
jgi:4-hydroxybenzoate polyprenyltransferase